MYISKKDREKVRMRFNGRCAYSGTELEADWQIDHMKPVARNWGGGARFEKDHCLENMYPVQKLINHYKHSYTLDELRNWLLGGLHIRLKKLPKNPYAEQSIKRKAYILKIAAYFDITADKPFSRIFYFETLKDETNV